MSAPAKRPSHGAEEDAAPASEPFAEAVRHVSGKLLPDMRAKRSATRAILDALGAPSPFGGAGHPTPPGPNSSRG